MDFRRLFDILPYQQARFAQQVALSHKKGIRRQSFSTEACLVEINRVSAGLRQLNLKKGDRVGIMTYNGSPQWNFLDLGMQQIGIVSVPIHASLHAQQLVDLIKDAGLKACVVANRELHEKVVQVQRQTPSLQHLFVLEDSPDLPGWSDITTTPSSEDLETIQAFKAAIHEDDLATIIYTSGTTGGLKGVMLSHKNLVSNIKATLALVPLNASKRTVSFLPMSHIFERMVVFTYMAAGASVYYLNRQGDIAQQIKEVRPHFFSSVPRILEKVYEGIISNANSRSKLLQKVIFWAIALGKKYKESKRMSPAYWWKWMVADFLVYRHWRRLLGNKIEGMVVGAAALNPELGRLFAAAGFEPREGYGMTETSPVIAFNRFEPGGVRYGTVGPPLPGVQIKIDPLDGEEEGEILVKGPNVMMGYYQNEAATQTIFNEEGWLHTGDVGRIVHKHFLQITGRKKDIFKTSSGKYVVPQKLEVLLKSSTLIEQVIIIGFNRPFVSALIVPCFVILKQWCEKHNIHWTAPQFMVLNNRVVDHYQNIVEEFNSLLYSHEQIKKFQLLYLPWTEEDGSLTPTLKPKRDIITNRHEKEISILYS
ncbi:MAG: long-chain fatty acid--CoA ligase [Bacteroidota bacterium]